VNAPSRFPLAGRLAATVAVAAAAHLFVSPALAATPGPGWTINSMAEPSDFSAADNAACEARPGAEEDPETPCDGYRLLVQNVGSQSSSGPITITDTLPPHLKLLRIFGREQYLEGGEELTCAALPQPHCEYSEPLPPGGFLTVQLHVLVEAGAEPSVINHATVEGGAAAPLSTVPPAVEPNLVEGSSSSFEFTSFGFAVDGPGGISDPQAGEHPSVVTAAFGVPTRIQLEHEGNNIQVFRHLPIQNGARDLSVDLPAGFVGDPQAAAQCSATQLTSSECPPGSEVGSALIEEEGLFTPSGGAFTSFVYNMVPEAGHPAEFGFSFIHKGITIYADLAHTASGYVLRASSPGIVNASLDFVSITFFGDPGSHDGGSPTAFLRNPTDCSQPDLAATVQANSWDQPDSWIGSQATVYPQVSGCELLQFNPTVAVKPEVQQAAVPSGYEVDLRVPQAQHDYAPVLATPDLKSATVTLPAGVAISPSAADGLAACPATGPGGIDIPAGERLPDEAGEGEEIAVNGLSRLTPGHCPAASQIGTVEIETPLLPPRSLAGHLYLAQPSCGGPAQPPCSEASATNGELYGLYLEVQGAGVVVKLKGEVQADPATGQLTTTFAENPQIPFSELRVTLHGGPRAPLANPPTCGHYTTTTDLRPYSAPQSGPDATPHSGFDLNTGPGGSACASTEAGQPNQPGFEAGTLTPLAGAYSPFILKASREEGTQRIRGIEATLPPGLLGKLAGIAECSDAQIAAAAANAGNAERANPSCPAASQIGTITVGAGPGSHPFYAHGNAYLAGPYKGAPLSLVTITPAIAGPFDLGVVVDRAATYVNPITAQIHAVTDTIPTFLDGIPLDIRSVTVDLDRPQFILNPTNCDPLAISASILSTQDQSAALSSPFQVGGCAGLPFKPQLRLALKGAMKRTGSPALSAVLTAKPGEAASAYGRVTLPGSEFVDNAHFDSICTNVQFNAPPGNGAQCPPGSIYGRARVLTPLIDFPEEGPVFLRSNPEAGLPDLVVALHGPAFQPIAVDLIGKVDSGADHGLRTTFRVIPDAPITRFELHMKGGAKGLLENSENLCNKHARSHAIADLTGQNGKHYDTKPKVANSCGKSKRHKRGGAVQPH
jgi:hypothetical protein